MRLIWIVLLYFIYSAISISPLIYTQFHEEKELACSEFFQYLVAIAIQLIILPPIAFLLLRLLKHPDCIRCPEILLVLTSGISLYQIFCLFIRIQAETTFNNPLMGYCIPSLLTAFCKLGVIACSIIFGAFWLIFTSLFLQYGIRSPKKGLGVLVLSVCVGVISLYAIYVVSRKTSASCPKTLLIWIVKTTIHIAAFFIVFLLCASHNIFDQRGTNHRVFGSFFFTLFIPFNLFSYFQGIEWIDEARNTNPGCIGNPNIEYLELAIYEWLIFGVSLAMVVCCILMKLEYLTREQLRLHPFLLMIGLPMEEIEEEWENPEQAENRVALLDSTVFDRTRHSSSFQEKAVCPICWENYSSEKRVTYFPGCEHIYHTECIKEWVHGHNTCPTCRRTLTPAIEMPEITHHRVES